MMIVQMILFRILRLRPFFFFFSGFRSTAFAASVFPAALISMVSLIYGSFLSLAELLTYTA